MPQKSTVVPRRALPLARVSSHFGISSSALKSEGAFDSFLERDAAFAIHPKLLDKTTAKEFKNARTDALDTFRDIIEILEASQAPDDAMWNEALKRFDFPEFRGVSLGFSAHSGNGRGWPLSTRRATLKTAKEIVDAGIKNPRIFELVGLFQDKVGPDLVSDMLGKLIIDKVVAFTQRVARNVGIEPMLEQSVEGYGKASLPAYIDSKGAQRYVLLVPKDILSNLPEVLTASDIGEAAAHNEAVRQDMNTRFGKHWRQRFERKKRLLRESIVGSKKFTEDLLRRYEHKAVSKYDIDRDPLDKISWIERAKAFGEQQPAVLSLTTIKSASDAQSVVRDLLMHFKHLVEHTHAKKLLYHKNGTPLDEKSVQYLFQAVALTQSLFTKLSVSPEVSSGRGALDFKFSLSTDVVIIVEIKLSNNDLIDGLVAQLPTYMTVERAHHGFLLVVDLGRRGSVTRLAELNAHLKSKPGTPPNVDVVICDAKQKPSASKVHVARKRKRKRNP